jgi:hypothetical protein
MQKVLSAAVIVSTLLSATAGFAQLGGGFQPPVYGSQAFSVREAPSKTVDQPVTANKAPNGTKTGSGTAAAARSPRTPG